VLPAYGRDDYKPEHLRAAMLYAADVVAMDKSIYQ